MKVSGDVIDSRFETYERK